MPHRLVHLLDGELYRTPRERLTKHGRRKSLRPKREMMT